MFVTIGQMKGQTLLPLPPQTTVPTLQPEQSMHSLKDQDKIHILESAIVTWTKQIKNVLKSDPDAPLKVCKARQGSGLHQRGGGAQAALGSVS